MKNMHISIYIYFLILGIGSFCAEHDFYKNYAEEFYDFSRKTNINIGIAVLGYNRTDYFSKTIISLASNPESQTLPFFIFLDGGKNAKQQELESIVKVSGIKEFYIIKQKKNLGCGRSIINARRFMFDWCKFEKIILFEDDLVVSQDYIRFVLNLHTWARENFSNVGVVTGFNLCFLDEQAKKNQLDCVQETYGNFWGYCIDCEVYEKIKNFMNRYERKFLMSHKKKNRELALWLRECLLRYINTAKLNRNINVIYPEIDYIVRFLFHISHIAVSKAKRHGQDIEMRIALFLSGFLKFAPVVNRALYIGAKGTHHTLASWNNKKYGDMGLYQESLQGDRNLNTFRAVHAFQAVIE
jgi:hypothetical protein